MPTRKRGKPRNSGERKRVAERTPRGRAEKPPATSARPRSVGGILVDEGLTGAQLRFVEELCADITRPAVYAARLAYPEQSEATHYSTASENLRKPKIRAAIQRRLSPLLRKTRTSSERVTQLVGDGMNFDPRGIIAADGTVKPYDQWPIECARNGSFDQEEIRLSTTGPVIGRIVKVRWHGHHTEYITLGAKMNRMLTDKVEHSGSVLEDLVAASRS